MAIPGHGPNLFCLPCLLGLGLNLEQSAQENVQDEGREQTEPAQGEHDTILVGEAAALIAETLGERIGRYRLLQEIGHGGCGVVYLAEQQEPVRRKVALKVIKLGMDTRQVVARFEAERQVLALMDHPNIARVLDAGATGTGRPYFVMELVGGIKITDYCDQNQLTIRQRLDLFIQVCRAIQHAHQKGIIHRDMKPSNVLVATHDGIAVPKVIDFGIAKATQGRLTDQTPFTAFEQFIGTPAYMSPEQAQLGGIDVDTRSDIYSLGVLLYELLTGRTPFEGKELLASGLEAMRRTIQEKEPAAPSTRLLQERVSTRSAGSGEPEIRDPKFHIDKDLDWIVMKCLEKDRTRRYQTANGLVRDIERHLSNEPVVARPPSSAYRVRKFVRRNKLLATAVAAVSIVLTLGISGVLWQWQRAEQHAKLEHNERRRAEQFLSQMEVFEVGRAEEYYESGNRRKMLPYLAFVLRQNPTNRLAAERLMSTLSHRSWARLACPPLEHSNRVTLATLNRDGQYVTTSSADHTAWVWEAATGRRVAGPLQHEAEISTSVFSYNGRFVVTASKDKTARVWDARTGKPITPPVQHTDEVSTALFNPEDTLVLTTSGALAQLWNVRTGQRTGPALAGASEIRDARFSPDGSRMALGWEDGQVQVWEVASGVCQLRFEHGTNLWSVAFSPDGKSLVTASSDNAARVWDVETGRPICEPLQHEAQVFGAEFSFDGHRIVTCSWDHTAQVWDASTGTPIGKKMKHDGQVRSALFSPDGLRVATASWDDTVRVWDALTGEALTEPLVQEANAFSAEFEPEGQRLLTASNGKFVTIWDINLAQSLRLPGDGYPSAGAFSPDGTRAIVGYKDGEIRIVNALTGKPLTVLKRIGNMRGVKWLEFSPDGGSVVAVDDAGQAGVWDSRTGQPLLALRALHDLSIASARFSHDGRSLVTASWDHSIKVWNVRTGEPRASLLLEAAALDVEFSPDDRSVLARGSNSVAKLWDLRLNRVVREFRHQSNINSAHFSHDGRHVSTASSDFSARVWDSQTGALVAILQHPTSVFSARFGPKDRLIVTASDGEAHTLRVWDAQTFQALTEPFGGGISPEFDPSGERLIDGSLYKGKNKGKAGRIWDVRTGLRWSEAFVQDRSCEFSHFSPDGKFILLARYQHVEIREVPPAPLPVPDWLPVLAEALAGQRFSQDGVAEPVGPAELWAVQQKMAAWAEAHGSAVLAVSGIAAGGTANRPRSAMGSDPHGEASPPMAGTNDADAFYARWAKWFLADATTRTVLPSSPLTLSNHEGQLASRKKN